jgi:hypothetical protein
VAVASGRDALASALPIFPSNFPSNLLLPQYRQRYTLLPADSRSETTSKEPGHDETVGSAVLIFAAALLL